MKPYIKCCCLLIVVCLTSPTLAAEQATFSSWLESIDHTEPEASSHPSSCRWEDPPKHASNFWRCAAGACKEEGGRLRKNGTVRSTLCDKHYTLASGSDRDVCDNGVWSSEGHQCVPCGRYEQPPAGSADFLPWQGSLFTVINGTSPSDLVWDMMCGVTIISPTLVITGGRCFTKAVTSVALRSRSGFRLEDNIRIVFGKLNSDILQESFPFSESVKEVVVPEDSTSLALLVLSKPVSPGASVVPACIDWKDVFPKPTTNESGLLGTWRTGAVGSHSSVFQVTTQKYLDHKTCQSLASTRDKAFISEDKFCLQVPKDSSGEDIVGSLTLTRDGAHYLYGVFNTRLPGQNKDLLVFTSCVQDEIHRSWTRGHWRRIHTELGKLRTHTVCSSDEDCLEDASCVKGECVNPCTRENACTQDCKCQVVNRQHRCDCPTVTRVEVEIPRQEGCEWPEPPENGLNYKNCGRQLCQEQPGNTVPENTGMTTKCLQHYIMAQGERESYCENGTWTSGGHRCIECGRSQVHSSGLIHYGYDAQLTDFPWMVGLYAKNISNQYNLICGGALISNHVILTAAHCFDNTTKENTKLLKVGLGKLKSDFYINEDTAVLKNVRRARVPENYIGIEHQFALDIALLDLEENIKISRNVMPACVDWDASSVPANTNTGYVAGFGLTDAGEKSDDLKWASQDYVAYSDCLHLIHSENIAKLTNDKFCINSTTGAMTAKGDSGGGLTFVREGIHYIYGVVSTRLPNPDGNIVLYSSVTEHRYWLLKELDAFKKWHFLQTQFDYRAGEDDVCKQVEDDLWYCRRQSNCPTALEALKNGTKPKTCYSEDGSTVDPVVCCEPEEKISPANLVSKTACKALSHTLNRQTYLCNLFRERIEPNTWLHSQGYAEFPHLAIITNDDFKEWKYASLLSDTYLITEAFTPHSLSELSDKPYNKALVGMFHINGKKTEREYDIVKVIVNDYNRLLQFRYYNNIALLKLGSKVTFSAAVRPICLHQQFLFPGQHVIMAGKINNTVLFKENTTVLVRKDCDEQGKHLDDSLICAAVDSGSVVEKEIGSPLMVRLDNPRCMYGLVGIFNYAPSDPNLSAYTRIYRFIPWIESVVWPQKITQD